jgi:hypothetical protein
MPREPAGQLPDRAAADDEHRAPAEFPSGQNGAERGGGRLHPTRLDTTHLVRQGVQGFW